MLGRIHSTRAQRHRSHRRDQPGFAVCAARLAHKADVAQFVFDSQPDLYANAFAPARWQHRRQCPGTCSTSMHDTEAYTTTARFRSVHVVWTMSGQRLQSLPTVDGLVRCFVWFRPNMFEVLRIRHILIRHVLARYSEPNHRNSHDSGHVVRVQLPDTHCRELIHPLSINIFRTGTVRARSHRTVRSETTVMCGCSVKESPCGDNVMNLWLVT